MSDEGNPLQPEHVFKKVIWRGTIEIGEALERSTTWTLGGVAAIVGLLISNLDSVAKIVSLEGIKTSIVLFTASLLAGAISKQIGMAVTAGLSTLKQVDSLFASDAGQALLSQMTISPRELVMDLAEPFVWPLSQLVRRQGDRGVVDYVASEKRFVRMLCIQILLNGLHGLLALAAFLTIALSI